MIVEGSREGRAGVSGGTGSRNSLDQRSGPGGSGFAVADARALLQRMIRTPGRPSTRAALHEDQAIRWVLDRCPPVPFRAKTRHLVALRRRHNRTGLHLGFQNRYSKALEWATMAARHG